MAADRAQVEALTGGLPERAALLAERLWPGPLTLVLAAAGLPDAITSGTGGVAVRVPDHVFLRHLCRRSGPLVSTSANQSGRPAPRTCGEALAEVGDAAAVAVEAGPGRGQPSTIVEMRESEPRLLREGSVAWDAVLRALRP